MITHLEPNILEWEVKWALESITTDKASQGDGIPVELFQILKDDAVKVLHSICQEIWKTQQWPQDWKRSVNFLIFKLVLEKAEEPEIKLPTSGSWKNQEFQKNIYFCFIDYAKAFDCVDHKKL